MEDTTKQLANSLNKEAVLHLLHSKVCEIEFTKVDGTLRKAKGTLVANLLPPVPEGKTVSATTKAPNPNLVTYFDTEAGAFRSFKIDALISIV